MPVSAPNDDDTWEFRGPIELRPLGPTLNYTVVYLPRALEAALPADAGANVRVYAVINEIDVEAAWQSAHGRWSMMVGKALQKATGTRLGDIVDVRFSLAPKDAVDVPDALRLALCHDDEAGRTFAGLTAGKQRALAHRVRSAKTAPTTARRVDEVVAVLAAGADEVAAFFGRKMQPAHKTAAKKTAAKKTAAKKTATTKTPTTKTATTKTPTAKTTAAKTR